MHKLKHIFQPIKIGNITVKNRIETAPAEPFLTTRDGWISPEFIEWHRTMARGGAGIVTIGDSPINEEYARESFYVVNLSSNSVINGLFNLTEVLHRYGAAASIELNLRAPYTPTEMTRDKIKQVIQDFAEAAYRCKIAGMDMVMIHGGHGHLVAQFFSPFFNKRTDEYGASTMENRTRFALELLDAVRDKIGDNMAIEYRISADEMGENGVGPEEALEFAKIIQDHIDLIHVSAGDLYNRESIYYMIQPTYIKRAVNLHYAGMFKKALKIPVTTVGSFDIELAEQAIAEGKADMVAMIRSFIAEPDLVTKAYQNKIREIRPCIRCTTCNAKNPHLFFLPIRCSVNPLTGREFEFSRIPQPAKQKKVVVVGGGPAGMEAARWAAGRGHEVVLFEKSGKLGGTLNLAAASPIKTDLKKYLDWAVYMTQNTKGIDIRPATEATAEIVQAEKPDAVIIAVGSEPFIPAIPGVDRPNVVWVGNVEAGKATVGDKAVIAGAGLTGSEAALVLAGEGKEVTIIDMLPLEIVDEGSPNIATFTLRSLLKKHGVQTVTEVKLQAVTEEGAVVVNKEGKEISIPCDTVILSLGVRPRTAMADRFRHIAAEHYVIGDCNNQKGSLLQATREGFFAAMNI